MPIDLRWLIKEEVMFVRLEGTISVEDVTAYAERVTTLLDKSTQCVHFIVDARHIGYFPTDEERLAVHQSRFDHAHLGWIMLYGNPLFTSLASRQLRHMPGVQSFVTTNYISALEELMQRGIAMEEARLLTEASGHITNVRA